MLLSLLNEYFFLFVFFAILLFVVKEVDFFLEETKVFELGGKEKSDGPDIDLEGFLRLVILKDFCEE